MGVFFDGFALLFGGALFLIVAVFIAFIVINVVRWNKNNASPKTVVTASVATKRIQNIKGVNKTSSLYYLTFEFSTGSREEFKVGRDEFGQVKVGDRGTITFRGTRFISFAPEMPELSNEKMEEHHEQ